MILTKEQIEGYKRALKEKAEMEGLTITEYCKGCTDLLILDDGELPVHWGNEYDFVVYGDIEDAINDVAVGDKIVRMTNWLIDNHIISKSIGRVGEYNDSEKTAVLVTFSPTTRVVINGVWNKEEAIKKALEKMLANPSEYLCEDNFETARVDNEMPYDPSFDDCEKFSCTSHEEDIIL